MATDISVMGRSFSVLENTNDNFWARVNNGAWEPETFEIFDRFVDEDTLVIDFGAWIGPTVLFAAQRAGMTLAFEPDQAAFKTLRNNVDLNAEAAWSSRIQIFEEGIHASGKPITIGAPGKAGNSTSGSLFAGRKASWTIETHRLQDVIAKHRGDHKKIFVKMDIEGGEYDLIPEITDLFADPSITFYISFHQRILRGFIEARTADEDAATEEYNSIMRKTYDCLPWDRTIERTNGKPFRLAMVKRRMANNRRLPPELVIY